MGRLKRMIENFLSGDKDCIVLDWDKMGYSSATSCRRSIETSIKNRHYAARILVTQEDMLLVKKNICLFDSPSNREAEEQTPCVSAIAGLLNAFLESSLDVYRIEPKKRGYVSATSCSAVFRSYIRNEPEFSKKVVCLTNRVDVFLVRLKEVKEEDDPLEASWH